MVFESLFITRGWRRRGMAVLLGVCAAAALPPFYVLPLLIPAFAGLFLLATQAPSRGQAFRDGWWWGFGYFTAGLYWICISLWVPPATFAWVTPFALFGLPAVLAVYTGLVTWLLRAFRVTCHVSRVTLFAFLWVASEYLRAHLFTGFPWNLIGYAFTATDATLQLASVTGIYGLGWFVVLIATAPALCCIPGEKEHARRPVLAAALLLVAEIAFGIVRLSQHPTEYTDVKVRIVQGNVAQSLKWDAKEAMAGLRHYASLTRGPGLQNIALVLWPETAVPYTIEPGGALAHDLSTLLPPKAILVTGALQAEGHTIWNSVFAINARGDIVASYKKHHLVPFGEYIPLRAYLPKWLADIAAQMGDFGRGAGPETLSIPPYPPVSPLICYEAIFPGEATDGKGEARWLLSVTDDAWFGSSAGLFQDAQMARVRAVEQGLPLMRAANTGISAAFDAYGRNLGQLPIEKGQVLDLYLSHAEKNGSIFSRLPICTILFLIASASFFLFNRRKPRG